MRVAATLANIPVTTGLHCEPARGVNCTVRLLPIVEAAHVMDGCRGFLAATDGATHRRDILSNHVHEILKVLVIGTEISNGIRIIDLVVKHEGW